MSPASPPPIINRCSAPSRSYVLAALRALHLDHACAPAFDGSHGEPGITKISLIQVSTVPGESRDPDPANSAAQAMRQRCYERFTELQTERETTQTQLDALDRTAARDNDTELLDLIPLPSNTIDLHPEHIQAALYQALDIQAVYKHDTNEVTFFATITTSTPHAIAAILADAGYDPTTSPGQPPRPLTALHFSPLAQAPIARVSHRDHEIEYLSGA